MYVFADMVAVDDVVAVAVIDDIDLDLPEPASILYRRKKLVPNFLFSRASLKLLFLDRSSPNNEVIFFVDCFNHSALS